MGLGLAGCGACRWFVLLAADSWLLPLAASLQVSEGLDFADGNARGVIIVGIPFPHAKDLKASGRARCCMALACPGAAKKGTRTGMPATKATSISARAAIFVCLPTWLATCR